MGSPKRSFISSIFRLPLGLVLVSLLTATLSGTGGRALADLKYWGGAKIVDLYRVRLDPGDYLLESVEELIKRENIKDGAVIAGIGTLSECRMHWITTTTFPSVVVTETLKEPLEVMAIHGIIADGAPHLHMSVSSKTRAVGGHVEPGCKILYLGELVVVKFDGPQLIRRPNEHGTNMLEKK